MMKSIVLYDDGEIIAVNKPAGLPTQGGTNIKRHLDGMMQVFENDKGVKPRIVHRLDKDTSGVLIMARSANMARQLSKLFSGRDIRKIYWALTIPAPEINQGEIRAPMIKAGGEGKEKMVIDTENGQNAITFFDVIERAHKQMAFVAFWPKTGRTHQIRVHANHMGCPILGDGKYGGQAAMIDDVDHPRRVHLHAQSIHFKHPSTGKDISISAPLSDEMKKSWRNFGFDDQPKMPFQDIK
jgi:23S rRNA pseudouridine955/2504/2580 synthase